MPFFRSFLNWTARCLIAGGWELVYFDRRFSLVYSIQRFDVSSFVARCTDNPIFILTISLNTEHFCYHCDYTHTQISLKAFKCYQKRFIYWITSRVFLSLLLKLHVFHSLNRWDILVFFFSFSVVGFYLLRFFLGAIW